MLSKCMFGGLRTNRTERIDILEQQQHGLVATGEFFDAALEELGDGRLSQPSAAHVFATFPGVGGSRPTVVFSIVKTSGWPSMNSLTSRSFR